MKKLLLSLKEITAFKALLISLSPVLVILLSMKTMILGLFIVVFIDLLTSIRKSHYVEGVKFRPLTIEFWRVIKSKKIRVTFEKAKEYSIYIIVFSILEGMILGGTEITFIGREYTLPELVIIGLFFIEIYSIGENLDAVSGSGTFSMLSRILPSQIRNIFQNKGRRNNHKNKI
jgi:hypothetical protein